MAQLYRYGYYDYRAVRSMHFQCRILYTEEEVLESGRRNGSILARNGKLEMEYVSIPRYLFCWHVYCDQLLSRCPADHQVLEGSFRREMSTTHIMRGSVVNKKQKKKEKKKKVNLTFDKP